MSRIETDNSITRSAAILQSISEGAERIIEISRRTNLRGSTVHRLLVNLKRAALVQQDPLSKRYFLGPLIYQLTANPIDIHRLLIINSLPEMQHLMMISRETVTLSVPLGKGRRGADRICLEEVESPESLKYKTGKGSVAPLFAGSSGKVLLSEMTDDQLELIFESMHFYQLQNNSFTSKNKLLVDIQQIRQCGYSTSLSERIAGCAAISVPIKNYGCPVAMSILGPETRFGDKMMNVLVPLQKSALKIAEKLVQIHV